MDFHVISSYNIGHVSISIAPGGITDPGHLSAWLLTVIRVTDINMVPCWSRVTDINMGSQQSQLILRQNSWLRKAGYNIQKVIRCWHLSAPGIDGDLYPKRYVACTFGVSEVIGSGVEQFFSLPSSLQLSGFTVVLDDCKTHKAFEGAPSDIARRGRQQAWTSLPTQAALVYSLFALSSWFSYFMSCTKLHPTHGRRIIIFALLYPLYLTGSWHLRYSQKYLYKLWVAALCFTWLHRSIC